MEAAWKMLQLPAAQDLLIASGETNSLESFLDIAFNYFNLNWKDHVITKDSLIRPSDLDAIYADPSKALQVLNWKSKVSFEKIVTNMIEYELEGKLVLL
jgi:GDPmannose 4,6-dehydratase